MKWDDIYKNQGVVQSSPLRICKKLAGVLPKNKKLNILDLGSGTGRHSFYFAKNKNWHIIAFDSSLNALKHIEFKIKQNNFQNIRTVHGDFSKLPFSQKQFDVIICTQAIHHATVKKIKKYTREMDRVLKVGGLILLVVPSIKDFRSRTGKILEDYNTRINCPELIDPKIPHHFFEDNEILLYFKNYTILYYKIITRIAIKGLKRVTYIDCILKKIKNKLNV